MSDLQFTIGFKTDQTGLRQLESDIEKITKKAKAIEAQIGAGISKGDNVAALKARYEKLVTSLTLTTRAHQELNTAMESARLKGQSLDSAYIKLTEHNLKNITVLGNLSTSFRQNSEAMNANKTSANNVANTNLATYFSRLESSLKDVTGAISSQTTALNTQNEVQKKSVELAEQRTAALKKANEARAQLSVTDETDKIVAQTSLLSKSMSVVKQALLTAPIYGLAYTATSQLSAALTNYIQLDTVLNRIAIVTGQTTEKVRALSHEFSSFAKDLNVTTETYAKGALIFYQQGGDAVKYVKELTEATLQLSNITGQASSDTADYITAIGNSFKMIEKGPAEIQKITDTLAYLDKASAASAYEIGEALKRSASVFESAGIDFQTASSMIATSLQITRAEPERVGTAFKTLIETMQEVKVNGPKAIKEFSNQIQDIIDKFPNLRNRLKLFENNGEMIGAKEFLKQLQSSYVALKETDPRGIIAVVQAIGGKENANILLSLLENQKLFQELVSGAKGSVGEAAKSQAEFSKSIQANIEGLKNAWEGLVDKLLSSDAVIGLVEALIKVFNTLGKVIEGTSGSLNILLTAFGAVTGLVVVTRLLGVFRAATTSSQVGIIDLTFALLGFKAMSEKGVNIDLQDYDREVEIAKIKTIQLREEMEKLHIQALKENVDRDISKAKKKIETFENLGEPSDYESYGYHLEAKRAADKGKERIENLKPKSKQYEEDLILFQKESEMRERRLKLLEKESKFAELGPNFGFKKLGTYTKSFIGDLVGDITKDLGPKIIRSLGMSMISSLFTVLPAIFEGKDLAEKTGKGFWSSFWSVIKNDIGSGIGGIVGGVIGGIFGPIGSIIGALLGNMVGSWIQGAFSQSDEEIAKSLESYKKLEEKRRSAIGLTNEEIATHRKLSSELRNHIVIVNSSLDASDKVIAKQKELNKAREDYLKLLNEGKPGEINRGLNMLVPLERELAIAQQKKILIDELNKIQSDPKTKLSQEDYNKYLSGIVNATDKNFSEIKKIVNGSDVFKGVKSQVLVLEGETKESFGRILSNGQYFLDHMNDLTKDGKVAAIKKMLDSFGISDDLVNTSKLNADQLFAVYVGLANASKAYGEFAETSFKIDAMKSNNMPITNELRQTYLSQRAMLADILGTTPEAISKYSPGGRRKIVAGSDEEKAKLGTLSQINTALGDVNSEIIGQLDERKRIVKTPSGGKRIREQIPKEMAEFFNVQGGFVDPGLISQWKNFMAANADTNEKLTYGINETETFGGINKQDMKGLFSKFTVANSKIIPVKTKTETGTKEKVSGASVNVSGPTPKGIGLDLIRKIETEEANIKNIKDSNIDLKKKIVDLEASFAKRDDLLQQLKTTYEKGLSKLVSKGNFLYSFVKNKKLKVDENGIITDASIEDVRFSLDSLRAEAERKLKARGYEGKSFEKGSAQDLDQRRLQKIIDSRKETLDSFNKEAGSYKNISGLLNKTKISISNTSTDEENDLIAIYEELLKPGPDLYKKETKNLAVKEEQLLGILDNKIQAVEEAAQTSKEKLNTLTGLYGEQSNLYKSAQESYDKALKTSMSTLISKYGLEEEGGVLSEASISKKLGILEDAYINAQKAFNEADKNPVTLQNIHSYYQLKLAQKEAGDSLSDYKDEVKSYEEIASNANKITEQAAEAFKKAKQSIIELGEAAAQENFTEILFGQTSLDKVDSYFSAVLDYQDEYLNNLEKSISLSKIQNKLDQDKIKYGNTPQLAAFQEKITRMKKDGKEYSEEELGLLNAEYDVSVKQVMLEKLKKNAGQETRLMRDSQGNWVYGASPQESKRPEDISNAQSSLLDSASDYYAKSQAAVKSTLNKMKEVARSLIENAGETVKQKLILEDTSATSDAKGRAAKQLEILDRIKINSEKQLSAEKATLGRETEYLKKAAVVAGSAAASDPILTGFLDKILTSSNDSISEIFGDKLPSQMQEMLDVPVSEIAQLTSMMGSTLTGLTGQLVSTIDTLGIALLSLSSAINTTVTNIGGSISQIAPNPKIEPGKIEPIVPAGTTPTAITPVVTEKPADISGYTWQKKLSYFGTQSKDAMEAAANEIDRATVKWKEYKANKDEVSAKKASAWASQIRKSIGFEYYAGGNRPWLLETGGYTGDFSGGRLAVLHSKEIVLNKQDTKNILDAVKINRSTSSVFKNNSAFVNGAVPRAGDGGNTTIINASFPNVSSSEEIRKAFANMSNSASQFAYKMRPAY